jgi:DNA-binding PadR family transcriptional regulator
MRGSKIWVIIVFVPTKADMLICPVTRWTSVPSRGRQSIFYGLTEEGREFLEDHNLLAAEETLQQIYETISDKPEKMVKYENAPRPDDR